MILLTVRTQPWLFKIRILGQTLKMIVIFAKSTFYKRRSSCPAITLSANFDFIFSRLDRHGFVFEGWSVSCDISVNFEDKLPRCKMFVVVLQHAEEDVEILEEGFRFSYGERADVCTGWLSIFNLFRH
jgi:hypothetical protein